MMSARNIIAWACLLAMLACSGCATSHGGGGAESAAAPPTSATAGETTLVAIAPPAGPPPQTLPQFLGLTGLFECAAKGAQAICDRLGDMFPSLKPIPSPDELGPDADAGSEAAAAIQEDEKKAAGKISALRYLAEHGCGCYPGVEEAFLAALDDCTEEVRFEAAKGLRLLAGNPCAACKSSSCCSEAVRQKLDEVANMTNEWGCYLEPSTRVRRMARLALQGCGGGLPWITEGELTPIPDEGPSHEDVPAAEELGMPSNGPLPPVADGLVDRPSRKQTDVQTVAYEHMPDEHEAMVVGRVNGEPVFEGELMARIAPHLAMLASKLSPDEHRQLQRSLMRHELQRVLDRNLLCQSARQQMPPVEVAAVIEQQRDRFASDPSPAGGALGDSGGFDAEQALATYWLERRVRKDLVVSVEDLLAYYQDHSDRFQTAKEVRWEQVTVPAGVLPESQAIELIDHLHRQALGDSSARPPAFGISAAKSRVNGWKRADQIPSPVITHSLFSISIGQISSVIRDADGWHFLRVLQRRAARRMPFEEVAETIRQKLAEQRRSGFEQAYMDHLRRTATIWTAFDPPRLR